MADDKQYIKLPDGSYVSFPSDMKDEDISSAISKNFPPGAPQGLSGLPQPATPAEAVPMRESQLGHVLTGPPLVSMQPGLPSPAQDPNVANIESGLVTLGAPIEGLATGGARALPAIGRSILGGVAGGAAGRYTGQGIGSIFGPRGRELGGHIGSVIGGLGGAFTGRRGFGEGEIASPIGERDATKMNVPFAGEEEPPPEFNPQPTAKGIRDPSIVVKSPIGPEPVGKATPFSRNQPADFSLPSNVPEREGVPGAGGESWSMQRKLTPELQRAAAAGDPGAIQTMRRLNPTWSPVIVPKEAEFQSPSLEAIRANIASPGQSTPSAPGIVSPGASRGLPRGNPTPFEIASPERRVTEGVSPTGTERRQVLNEANQIARQARPAPRNQAEADAEIERQMNELVPEYLRKRQQ